MNEGMFSSDRQDWETPQEFFDKLDAVYHFTLDVCATKENAKCEFYYSPQDNGLEMPWSFEYIKEVCWLNPPYGREIGRWVKKAYEEAQSFNCVVVALLPARTDTAWWHDYVMKAQQIYLIRGRLKFVGGKSCAPFPSAVVVFANTAGHVGVYSMER